MSQPIKNCPVGPMNCKMPNKDKLMARAPRAKNSRGKSSAQALGIVQQRCTSCHSATPSDEVFTVAPGGVMLDSLPEIRQWASRIKARTIDASDMPFMNKTGMSDLERAQLGEWLAAGAQ